jgi:hypothetical protein
MVKACYKKPVPLLPIASLSPEKPFFKDLIVFRAGVLALN